MPKKYSKPSFSVVVDTNALYAKDTSNVVSPKFLSKWAESCEMADLALVVPEVVRGERLYQLVQVAMRSIENAKKNFETINKVCGHTRPLLPSPAQVRRGVEQNFDNWLKRTGGKIFSTPIAKINWEQVVNDAIWRVPPFAASSEEQDSEKGFRDRLVLETLQEIVAASHGQQIVFISHDGLLREAVAGRFDSKAAVAYENIDAFASYLKLTHETTTKEFAQTLVQKAPMVFYSPNDPDCVFSKFGIAERITHDWAFALDSLLDTDLPSAPVTTTSLASMFLVPASEEKLIIEATQFQRVAEGFFHWETTVKAVRLFRKKVPLNPAFVSLLDERVRIQNFIIGWKSVVDEELNFSKVEPIQISLGEKAIELAYGKFNYGFGVPLLEEPKP